ncbi:hypothetical protein IDSA_05625 [Pseudidiomarina salinarum]|uniref:DUF1653 domain-containing protein n=1 Tax=Pseudidiomarina salinarum TaxID=435908 RepID=A0A094IQV6_9GAMM|nr:DUF1653 domain-containing protein [Pseudidiomarina salinarum]KFZ30070.1 hypothetical protein IDSA_05625 [Pseudidiomarina salinarum]RUO70039.1 DUF1653 domain-containing protein [Pseudidiomarina salinarum]
MPTIIPGIYRHFKGKDYEVIGVARHSETEEDMVVYRPLDDKGGKGELWVRPLEMFTEMVEHEGMYTQRFRLTKS